MNIKLEVNPLSVNKAWQGRRFKSAAYKKFEIDVAKALPFSIDPVPEGEVFVRYIFHVKNYGNADTFNMEKTISDLLVKRGYLKDDRYIRAGYVRKERAASIEWIDVTISPYIDQDIQ